MLPIRNPKVIYRPLATGAVLYSTSHEVCFGLTAVGARVWEMLPPVHRDRENLCRILASDYPEIREDMLRTDVAQLLEELSALGLVLPPEAPAQQVA